LARVIEAARAKVDGEHRLGVDGVAPVDELMHTDRIAVGRVPGEGEARRTLFARSGAVFPSVGRNEIAAGIADIGNLEIAHELGDVPPHAVLVGGRMVRLVDAGIDRPSQMFEEGAVEPVIYL